MTQAKTKTLESLGLRKPDGTKMPVLYKADSRAAAFLEALGRRIDAAVEKAVAREVGRRMKQAMPVQDVEADAHGLAASSDKLGYD
jgi:hypothetical protein